jgi:hypothetical protein
MSMPNRCLRGHFVGDTACRVCEPGDYVLGVRRVPELDAQLDRDLQAIREAERSVDLNMRIGEPWTGWTMEAEPQDDGIEVDVVHGGINWTDVEPEISRVAAFSVRPRHRRPVKRRLWKWGRAT